MLESINVKAFITTSKLDLARLQAELDLGRPIRKEFGFLLYEIQKGQYLYIKNYGGIVHFNIAPEVSDMLNAKVCSVAQAQLAEFTETLAVKVSSTEDVDINFDELIISRVDLDSVHIICLNLSQSVALFHFQHMSNKLLEDTKKYNLELESMGKSP